MKIRPNGDNKLGRGTRHVPYGPWHKNSDYSLKKRRITAELLLPLCALGKREALRQPRCISVASGSQISPLLPWQPPKTTSPCRLHQIVVFVQIDRREAPLRLISWSLIVLEIYLSDSYPFFLWLFWRAFLFGVELVSSSTLGAARCVTESILGSKAIIACVLSLGILGRKGVVVGLVFWISPCVTCEEGKN
jgi:hypothetical protein